MAGATSGTSSQVWRAMARRPGSSTTVPSAAASCEAAARPGPPSPLDPPEYDPPAARGVARRDGPGSPDSLSQPAPMTSRTATSVTPVGAAAGWRSSAAIRARGSPGRSAVVSSPFLPSTADFLAFDAVLSACFPVIAGAVPFPRAR